MTIANNRYLFSVESPFQVLGALAIASELPKDAIACLVINGRFKSASSIYERVVATKVFEKVCLLYPEYGNPSKTSVLASIGTRAQARKRLSRVINDIGDDQFGTIFCAGASNLNIDLKRTLVIKGRTELLDDGTGSHNGAIAKAFSCLDDIINEQHVVFSKQERKKLLLKRVLRAFPGESYQLNVKEAHLFNPTTPVRQMYKIEVAPIVINDYVREECSVIFSAQNNVDYSNRVIYLGLPDNAPIQQLENESIVLRELYAEFGTALLYKSHPRRRCYSLIPNGVEIDDCEALWEALWFTGSIDESAILVGCGSSAQTSPKMVCGKEPRVFFTYGLLKNCDVVNYELLFRSLKQEYVHNERIHVPFQVSELILGIKDALAGVPLDC